MNNCYETPLSTRYASAYMSYLFSNDMRYQTWRKLWISLAKAQKKLGLPIVDEQIVEMERNITNIDYQCVREKEIEVKHDVMAHVYAYGKVAPLASGIIHLGATSCYVTDNADLIIYRDALVYLKKQVVMVCNELKSFAFQYKDVPTLGYTHYQPAQLVTVGKRATLWLQDFMMDMDEIDYLLSEIKFLGSRGTTGTEASFLDLFDNNGEKVDLMNEMICKDFGFTSVFSVCGQTYPRKVDSKILNCLSSVAQSCYRMANDIRLLQHDRQLEEPFDDTQIGSSAMAYKRNPMRCERICSLSRYIMSNASNAMMTASNQWLERSLDDSANRRLSMPEGFLCTDAILSLAQNVAQGLKVNEKMIEKAIDEFLPFIATENIMMEAVKKGGNRQEIHEIIRKNSMKATAHMKQGNDCKLLNYLSEENQLGLTKVELDDLLNPNLYIGRCKEQVESYIKEIESKCIIDAVIKTDILI